MRSKVYIETTIPSYLGAKRSRDGLIAAHQQITRECWASRRSSFDLYVSEIVLRECRVGDPDLAASRMRIIASLPALELTEEVLKLADSMLSRGVMPPKAGNDALHLSVATLYGCEYLLTWNCRHLANAEIQRPARVAANKMGWDIPIVCTPEELMGT
jgi:hypothetical protein